MGSISGVGGVNGVGGGDVGVGVGVGGGGGGVGGVLMFVLVRRRCWPYIQ
jgi:hypothetical protein